MAPTYTNINTGQVVSGEARPDLEAMAVWERTEGEAPTPVKAPDVNGAPSHQINSTLAPSEENPPHVVHQGSEFITADQTDDGTAFLEQQAKAAAEAEAAGDGIERGEDGRAVETPADEAGLIPGEDESRIEPRIDSNGDIRIDAAELAGETPDQDPEGDGDPADGSGKYGAVPIYDDKEAWFDYARRLGLTVEDDAVLADVRAAALDYIRPAGNEGTDKWLAFAKGAYGLTFPEGTGRKDIKAATEQYEKEHNL